MIRLADLLPEDLSALSKEPPEFDIWKVPCEGCTCGIAEYEAKHPNAPWRCGTVEQAMCEKRKEK